MKWILWFFTAFYLASSYLPIWRESSAWIRMFDYPRLQLFIVGVLTTAFYLYWCRKNWPKRAWVAVALVGALGLDLYRIAPYTPLHPLESKAAESAEPWRQVKIFISNVLQYNTEYARMSALIASEDPDGIVLAETDQAWVDQMAKPLAKYPFQVLRPISNTYGIAMYSRLPLENTQVRFLENPEIPSVRAILKMRNGDPVDLFALHPLAPIPTGDGSESRDVELIKVAKEAAKSKLPILVMGDINDVAWSHTTRLFRRISKLLDPRMGRGIYATCPARPFFVRYPIDHVFHSEHFRLVSLQVHDYVGSDHLPMTAILSYEPAGAHEQPQPKNEPGDHQEATRILNTTPAPRSINRE